MDDLEARVMVLEAKMEWSENSTRKIDRHLKSIDHRMERLETRMDGLETRLGGVENEVQILGIRMEERFKTVDERFRLLGVEISERFKTVDERFKSVDERFKRTELYLKILILLSLLGLTFANPGFTGPHGKAADAVKRENHRRGAKSTELRKNFCIS